MKSAKYPIILMVALLLHGCSATPVSSVGLYSDVAEPQSVKGSWSQAVVKRTFQYTADEVFDASESALFRKGLNVEEKNGKKGKITASGQVPVLCAGNNRCYMNVTVAAYVKQISTRPTSQLTLLVDRQTFFEGIGSGWIQIFANDVVSDIQKVLSTYK